jgi:hypothetical protein
VDLAKVDFKLLIDKWVNWIDVTISYLKNINATFDFGKAPLQSSIHFTDAILPILTHMPTNIHSYL